MSYFLDSIIETVTSRLPLTRTNTTSSQLPTMSSSERQPLLSGSVNGSNLPSRGQVQNAMPSKGQRIQMAKVSGALQAGKLPSQQQISKLIQVVLDSDTLKAAGGPNSRTARLGPEGQRVLEDSKAILRATKAWGEAKNDDDLLQNFFYNAATADVDVDVNTASAPSQKELSRDGQRAIESFRTIASLIITNPTFRKIGSDLILLSRDILADAATVAADQAKEAAQKSRPSEKERKEGVDFEGLKKKGKATAKGVASGKLQGEAREGLWDELENAKQYLDDKLPEGEEAREKLIQRLQEVVTQAQSDPKYRRAITTIVDLFKKYASKASDALDETKEKSEVSDEDEKVQQAGRDLKLFVERVSNKSLDDVINATKNVTEDVKNDEKLSAFFSEVDQFFDRVLYQPGYVVSQRAYRKVSTLYDDSQALIAENPKWKEDAAELQKQLEAVVNGVANDKPTNRLVEAIEQMGDSVTTAGKIGVSSLKFEGQGLYRDILDVLVPRLIGLVKEIPVPRVEFKSEDASEYDASVRLRVEGLHFSASNIAFWLNLKTGFIPFEDSGILDIQFGPQGVSFDVTLENAHEDNQETFFVVKDVQVWISGFDFQIREHQKWLATWFAKPVIKAFVKRNLTSALEAQIAEYLRVADFRLYGLQQRAIAATNARPTAVNFLNAVFSDSIFPQSSDSGPVKMGSKGVVKYGRRGEYVLHIGVDEDLFPNKPPSNVSNTQRDKLRAKAQAATGQATGSADQFKAQAKGAANKAQKEGEQLNAKAQEAKKREERKEGWRSEAFDL
ncbi:hypothetical protein CI109_103000 [Kwoniella shandongensis]|uniref:HAM1-like N-terminal domain-containing protein n=1 Tax=Kwoniella shandongensis TaxID=1734106 RepID=A0AAJ8LIT0_9TREE